MNLMESVDLIADSDPSPFLSHDTPAETNAVLYPAYKSWLEKHESDIQAKRKSEEERLEKVKNESTDVLKKLLTERLLKIESNKERNAKHQEQFKADIESSSKSGSDWERVASLVDLSVSASTNPGERDRSRLREVLIKLKH
eukprot:TRINITY_DN7754_c0_g2_i1.p1 TRINITY_DN7754_c0_g2~~TRINITY_DN7754_c0_g2_i1.p1  ORF type:complete len:142 (+),score=44.47 TRINITY_DN7754_c0_g2_i1:29-454(+)